MRKFLLVFCSFWFLYFCMIGSIRFYWIKSAPRMLNQDFISSDIHSVVLGASTGACAWNDTLIPHSRNYCDAGTSLASSYNKLKWITEYNREQVDTILLCACLVSFINQNDNSLDIARQESDNILEYGTYFNYFKYRPAYWINFFTSFSVLNLDVTKFRGGYTYIIRDKLDNPNLYNQINGVINYAGGRDGLTTEFLKTHCKYQLDYLRRIRDYCKEHNKTLVILSTPIFKIPDMIDYSGYNKLIQEELGDSALIADYTQFEFPDSTYYGDLEHLNYRGAEYFSKHIAKNGIELRYAIDYCK